MRLHLAKRNDSQDVYIDRLQIRLPSAGIAEQRTTSGVKPVRIGINPRLPRFCDYFRRRL